MGGVAPLRVAIVGAGPSGFYAAGALLAEGFAVDLFDQLPTPYGLVRSGVAPDHPKIKAVTRVYERIAARPGFRFHGGVDIGADIAVDQLRERFDALLYTVGTPHDNRLGIPGEDALGAHPSAGFVAWYNGHPDHAGHEFDLDVERAVVIGNGNVALDVARMLVLDPDELAATDAADHALAALAASRVREVVVLGRRGPAQAAFTNPELRELGALTRADVAVRAEELVLDPGSAAAVLESTELRHRLELLREYAARPQRGLSHTVALRFLRSPVELLVDDRADASHRPGGAVESASAGDRRGGARGRVRGVRIAVNELVETPDGRLAARDTGARETIDCGLVIRAVGYRGRPLPSVPFDPARGLIPNVAGRVLDSPGGAVRVGEYVAGWVKRGPSGVIGTNKQCAVETVAAIVADRDAGVLGRDERPTADELDAWLASACDGAVRWDGWSAIDAHERERGAPAGRPRVKLVDVARMHAVARAG
jgi:ferredoxin--NADP+ reductase